MTSKQKRQHWQEHINRWQGGSLTQGAYCQEHSLTKSSFSYWRKRFFDNESKNKPCNKFIPVNVPTTSSLTLSFSGVHLELPTASLEQVLPVVLRTLREVH